MAAKQRRRLMNTSATPDSEKTVPFEAVLAGHPTIEIPIRQTTSKYPHRHRLMILGALAIMALAGLLALGAGAWFMWQSDWVTPGVQVFGIDLGGQTKSDSVAMLSTYWRRQEILLQDDDSGDVQAVSPEALGMTFDPVATVDLAYQRGRSLDYIAKAVTSGEPIVVPPVWMFDTSQARDFLSSLRLQYDIPPEDAGVNLTNGRVVVTPAVPGRRLDVSATWTKLIENPAHVLSAGQLPLMFQPVQPNVADVSAVVEQVEQRLSTVYTVRAYDPILDEAAVWELVPEVWSNWISLSIIDAGSGQFSWSLDQEAAKAYLEAQAQTLGTERYLDLKTATTALAQDISEQETEVRLRIYHHTTQHVVQPGETLASIGRTHGIPYPWIQQENADATDQLRVGQIVTIPSLDEMLPLPVIEGKRIVVSISQQRMWVYENESLKWDWPVSTGIDSSPTSPGVFQIQSHEPNAYAANWDLWMPHFLGIYRPVPTSSFMNGFHGFPTRDGANLLWTGNLGSRVTYGCILISTTNAAQLFQWADQGVVVAVQQ